MIRELPPCSNTARRVTCTYTMGGGGGGGRGDERVASLQQHGEQSDPHLVTQQVGGM